MSTERKISMYKYTIEHAFRAKRALSSTLQLKREVNLQFFPYRRYLIPDHRLESPRPLHLKLYDTRYVY